VVAPAPDEDDFTGEPRVHTREFRLDLDTIDLPGTLSIPTRPRGLAIFVHARGGSHLSARNMDVARALQRAGIATLLFDLLAKDETEDADVNGRRIDAPQLADRLLAVARWAATEAFPRPVPLGYFGVGTGGAVALIAAAVEPALVSAVVSLGGRPDLADQWLPRVVVPTLLIAGGGDSRVVRSNEQAAARLGAPPRLAVIPGATHPIEEPDALAEVASLAVEWLTEHFGGDEVAAVIAPSLP
jgi:putative phosphoribosyl transferase